MSREEIVFVSRRKGAIPARVPIDQRRSYEDQYYALARPTSGSRSRIAACHLKHRSEVKTFKSTLNRHLFAGLTLVLSNLVVFNLTSLQPYRSAVATTLHLPAYHLWILGAALSSIIFLLIVRHLHAQLSETLETVSNQCANGHLATSTITPATREIRIIRDYIRQCQERVDQRAAQIKRMETDIYATREERDLALDRIGEAEDLLASYLRIREELNLDNTKLRHEILDLREQIDALEQQLEIHVGTGYHAYQLRPPSPQSRLDR